MQWTLAEETCCNSFSSACVLRRRDWSASCWRIASARWSSITVRLTLSFLTARSESIRCRLITSPARERSSDYKERGPWAEKQHHIQRESTFVSSCWRASCSKALRYSEQVRFSWSKYSRSCWLALSYSATCISRKDKCCRMQELRNSRHSEPFEAIFECQLPLAPGRLSIRFAVAWLCPADLLLTVTQMPSEPEGRSKKEE